MSKTCQGLISASQCPAVLPHRNNLGATFFDFANILLCASWGILGIHKKQFPSFHSELSDEL